MKIGINTYGLIEEGLHAGRYGWEFQADSQEGDTYKIEDVLNLILSKNTKNLLFSNKREDPLDQNQMFLINLLRPLVDKGYLTEMQTKGNTMPDFFLRPCISRWSVQLGDIKDDPFMRLNHDSFQFHVRNPSSYFLIKPTTAESLHFIEGLFLYQKLPAERTIIQAPKDTPLASHIHHILKNHQCTWIYG